MFPKPKHTGNSILRRGAGLLLPVLLFTHPVMALAQKGDGGIVPAFGNFFGRLHPLFVHFPVALLVVVLLLEIPRWLKKQQDVSPVIKTLIYLGAGSAVLSVAAGLVLSSGGDYAGNDLETHRWAGTICMAAAVITALLLTCKRIVWYRYSLSVSVIAVIIAGHWGSYLTHGRDFLTEPFAPSGVAVGNMAMVAGHEDGPLNEEQLQQLTLEVRTIFAHSCNNCHGEAKSKGGLRLDTKEFIFAGGENGKIFIPGNPGKSELIRRISLPEGHKELMPTKGKHLSEQEISTLSYWIEKGAPWPDGKEKSIYRIAVMAPRMPGLPPASATLTQPVDRLVNAYFQKKKIAWKPVVDDRTYFRRIHLDITGLLPSPEKTEAFVKDPNPDKRKRAVKELLGRNHDYAQHWLTFWNDLLRNDYTGTGYITGGRSAITNWLYQSLLTNKPYHTLVSELISPSPESEGFIRGIEWRGTINASQRTEMQAAQNVAQVTLGLNLKCASCHDSFISDWKLEDAYAFANIFANASLEIHRCDKPTRKMASSRMLFGELGKIDADADRKKRLEILAGLLTRPEDGRFYRTIVNRVWAQVMGRGIVEPVDMMDNVPWDQDLLDYLAWDFQANGSDLKRLLEQILISDTYQQPSVAVKDAALLTRPDFVFEGMIRRRLTAEQFSDGISAFYHPVYSDSALVLKQFPENIRKNMVFPRASMVRNDAFLTALGRPNRETVTTGRASQASLLQALELSNGKLFSETLKKGSSDWIQRYKDPGLLIREMYRKALNRDPSEKESALARKILGNTPSAEGIQDLAWALALHPEFQLIF